MKPSETVQALLLDIEGTTTPIDYVFGVLFPFARDQVRAFLQAEGHTNEVQADLKLLREEYTIDRSQHSQSLTSPEATTPEWTGTEPIAAVPYIHDLISLDRKSTGLKSLQGKIWERGYRDGQLRSQVFPDIKPALERWVAAGKKVYIFSSGSVQAQQLLFRHTEFGDLTPFLSGYFDTRTGPKREAVSYQIIAETIGLPTNQILFISDVVAELQAAQNAGMRTLFSFRPGNHSSNAEGFELIQTFEYV